jgi:trehalose 6-phosphate phosphatase
MDRETTEAADRCPPPSLQDGDCLFLDLDGTLLDLRDDPHGIEADEDLRIVLLATAARLGDALAIVSGRPLAVIDACLAPARFAAAGLHGLERRGIYGITSNAPMDRAPLQDAAQSLTHAMEGLPMTILENKGASLALHWRRAPEHEGILRALAHDALQRLGKHYRLLEGNCVIELLPRAASKGDAIRNFLDEAPFQGRRPITVGDDVTDLSGFSTARAMGGFGVAVGTRVQGDFHLPDVRAVRRWLRGGSHD